MTTLTPQDSNDPHYDHPVDWRWLTPILISIASMLGSSFVVYTSNDKQLSGRVTAVETNRENDVERLKRIEDKLDRLIERAAP
ncbi:MAG: hypothetical protein E6R03_09195 [Hyphomicrobiaceae bacterium]|nr:MAG: hypothetical protein E6R03_09195 [Hyphomicrobiaceae bacterium]